MRWEAKVDEGVGTTFGVARVVGEEGGEGEGIVGEGGVLSGEEEAGDARVGGDLLHGAAEGGELQRGRYMGIGGNAS